MYISKIQLDPRKRKTLEALRNREILHAAIERSVEGDRPHILWRLEPDMSILAVSEDIPYLGDIQFQFGDVSVKPETKPYDEYVESISNGDLMRFTLAVNPVIRKSGKDVPLNIKRTQNYSFSAEDWAKAKLEDHGAGVKGLRDISHETIFFYKDGKKIPIFLVTYTGFFEVRNADLVKKATRTGIGGKKTYGCGMLTAVKVRNR